MRGIKTGTAALLACFVLPGPMPSFQASSLTIAASKCMGSVMAPVHLELYSDFQCPHCRKLYLETIRPVIADCVKNGKVYLIHHDFPLPGHPTPAKQPVGPMPPGPFINTSR